jgi:hypothetical protein
MDKSHPNDKDDYGEQYWRVEIMTWVIKTKSSSLVSSPVESVQSWLLFQMGKVC